MLSKRDLCSGKNAPSFVADKHGPHRLMYANYTSTGTCNEAEFEMQRWLAKRNWDASELGGLHVYVKQKGFKCGRGKCVCRPIPKANALPVTGRAPGPVEAGNLEGPHIADAAPRWRGPHIDDVPSRPVSSRPPVSSPVFETNFSSRPRACAPSRPPVAREEPRTGAGWSNKTAQVSWSCSYSSNVNTVSVDEHGRPTVKGQLGSQKNLRIGSQKRG